MVDEKTVAEDEKSQSTDSGRAIDKEQKDNVGFKDYLRIFTYSDRWDWLLNATGALAAIASGASLAL